MCMQIHYFCLVLLCPTSKIASPIFAGDMVTTTPASFSASIFASAPPLPPAMIAPACPGRGGRGEGEGRERGGREGRGGKGRKREEGGWEGKKGSKGGTAMS